MAELPAPRNQGFRFRMLRRLARFVQKYAPMGKERLLRALYSPDARRHDHIDIVVEYDDDLLINVDTASFLEWSIFFYGYYEPELSRLVKRVLRPGQVALDVGANIGCHTLLMGRGVGEAGRVLAVEPNPKIGAKLADNLRLNRLANVQVLPCALSDSPGELTLYVAPDDFPNQGMSSLYQQEALSLEVPVTVRTMDEVMQESGCQRLDFVKIDTQGNDYGVILGGERSIQEHRPHLVFEYDEGEWGRAQVDFSACETFFGKLGYTLYVLDSTGTLRKAKYGVPPSTNIFAVPPLG